ncbi:GNAT family N-acetyltransferase [Rubrobacter indicoceani]|uniref:GNAT family N-acetyltransferase n=1 Tax=Rubrobacter indicoceani TaxID=2051957 RepID=UPI0013C4BC36|nr:GNAT family N-acetyltransferase [Rubrobacter indicoceani]
MQIESVLTIDQVKREKWRAVEPPDFPFFDHEFLLALERSGSVGSGTGWMPVYLLCTEDIDGESELLGALCTYVKTDSYGEFIFDWDWAHAYQQNGMPYYPKLTMAVPFTPATGPKFLVRDELPGSLKATIKDALLDAAAQIGDQAGVSSTHALFLPDDEVPEFRDRGFAIRHSMQFHWRNRGYAGFDDYLGAMQSKRRRQIARERRQLDADLKIERLTGDNLEPHHAQAMFHFYLDTSDRKWGSPYLTAEFFEEVFETMADRILLVAASEGDGMLAGALNFYKGNSLFGRYWGTLQDRRNLHFELCYYQQTEFCIERGMELFEAGAQGEHKLARGFLPTTTYSAHEIRHPAFRRAIEGYVEQEREVTRRNISYYMRHDPFKAPDAAL